MKIRVNFGISFTKYADWWGGIEGFPNILSYRGIKYSFFMYDKDPSGQSDYIFTFSEIQSYDPDFHITCESWEDKFGSKEASCECGAAFSSFAWDHMRFCKMWKPWSYV